MNSISLSTPHQSVYSTIVGVTGLNSISISLSTPECHGDWHEQYHYLVCVLIIRVTVMNM